MTRRTFLGTTLGIVALAAAIRFVGIGWDRPHYFHPDEHVLIDPALRLLATGQLHARIVHHKATYIYPPLFSEILALEAVIAYPLSSWPNLQRVPADAMRRAGRATSCVAALLSVALLVFMARRLTGSAGAGLIAGAVLALSPLHAESSRYATTDVLAGLWVLLAAAAAVRIVEEGRWRHYLLGSVAVGLAAATKYPAGAACVLIGAAHFARPGLLRAPREHLKIVSAALAAAGGMVLALPPGLVHWEEVIAGVRYASMAYGKGHYGFVSPHPAWDALRTLGQVALGWGGLLSCLFWLRGRTSRRRLVPLVVLVGAYLGLLGVQKVYMARNLIHFLPVMVLLASWGTSRALALAGSVGSQRWLRWPAIAAAAALSLVQPAALAAQQVRALAPVDNRIAARDWIAHRLRRGSRIIVANSGYEGVPLPIRPRLRRKNGKRGDLEALYVAGYRWVVYTDASDLRYLRNPERFPAEAEAARAWLDKLERSAKLVRRFQRRPLPGWNLPGSTANMYHQPEVSIYRLTGAARPTAEPGDAR